MIEYDLAHFDTDAQTAGDGKLSSAVFSEKVWISRDNRWDILMRKMNSSGSMLPAKMVKKHDYQYRTAD